MMKPGRRKLHVVVQGVLLVWALVITLYRYGMVEESKINWPPATQHHGHGDDDDDDGSVAFMDISPPVTRAASPFTIEVPCARCQDACTVERDDEMSDAYLVDLYGGIVPIYCLDCSIPSDDEDPADNVMDEGDMIRRHRMSRGVRGLLRAVRRRRDVLFDTR